MNDFAYGQPEAHGRLRCTPEDFRVDEQLGFDFSGDGEHVMLRIRKRNANTQWVAERLAAYARIPPANVGYAGLKDRNGVTTQWFSLQLPGTDRDWAGLQHADFTIVDIARHNRKLRRGALRANQFTICVRAINGAPTSVNDRWRQITRFGIPNYFGPQRFGHDRQNIDRALAMFAGRKVRNRNQRSLFLSAARSELFNRVLAIRVADGTWTKGMDGDIMQLDGSHSWFNCEQIDTQIRQRLDHHDIHCSGPLWGDGEVPTTGAARALEQSVAQAHPALAQGLAGARLEHDRRALRVVPEDPACTWVDPATCEFGFKLPAGSYATSVMRELLVVREPAPEQRLSGTKQEGANP